MIEFNFEGAIFDADGTLLDSMFVWDELGERFLRLHNVKPEKNIAEILAPMTLTESAFYLNEKYSLNMRPEKILDEILKIIENFYRYEVKLRDGVENLLKELHRRKIPMVIATSGDRELLNAALKRNKISEYFKAVFTSDELNTTKREAKIFMACSEFLNLKPEKIAVFEDAPFAIETAEKAGFITISAEEI